MLGPGEVIEIDLVERVKNMTPEQTQFAVDHTRIIAENYAKNPWPNVGTIGHCDHPYSRIGPYAFETPLFYAIKQAITKL